MGDRAARRVSSAPAPWLQRGLWAFLRLVLRVFFRRVEVVGLDRVPTDRGVVFVLNHPNALVDPALLLTHAGRPVAFLAKAPLFSMPVVGFLTRALGAIPVYRPQDCTPEEARRLNRATFAEARRRLESGDAIALFPEGTSHDAPHLQPFKTGAARIALGAAAQGPPLSIVPVGLFYSKKDLFRSDVVLHVGAPIEVPSAASLDERGEPDRQAVRALTDRIERALGELVVQAEEEAALALARRVAELFEGAAGPVEDYRQLLQRLLAGYHQLRCRAPDRLAGFTGRLEGFESSMRALGLDATTLTAIEDLRLAHLPRRLLLDLLLFILTFPGAAVGIALHWPAYRLVGRLARWYARGSMDLVSTAKVLAGLLVFPLTWVGLALVGALVGGGWLAATMLVVGPASAWVALNFLETFQQIGAWWRALGVMIAAGETIQHLRRQREELRAEVWRLDAFLAGRQGLPELGEEDEAEGQ